MGFPWRDGRAVDCSCLENSQGYTPLGGSNPSPSAAHAGMLRPEVPIWWTPLVLLENGPQQVYVEALRRRSLHVHPHDPDSWRLLLDEHQGIARARHAEDARRGNDVLFAAVVGELALQLCVERVGGGNAGLKVGRPLLDLMADQPLLGEVDAKEERRERQQHD